MTGQRLAKALGTYRPAIGLFCLAALVAFPGIAGAQRADSSGVFASDTIVVVPDTVGVVVLSGGVPAPSVVETTFEEGPQPGPLYQTVFDRDRSRSNWSQTLSYSRVMRRTSFDGSGSVTTQDLVGTANKSKFGEFAGRIDARLTRRWTLTLDGRYGMNSSRDASRNTQNRDNSLQIRSQYTLNPLKSMTLSGGIYSEFQQNHDKSVQELVAEGDPDDPSIVDTLIVQRDSSYTSAREDGLNAFATWRVNRWLDVYGTATASRKRPSQRSLVRDFAIPLDGSAGTDRDSLRTTREPTDNSAFSSRITFTGIPLARLVFGSNISSLDQSRFDPQLRGQENLSIDRLGHTLNLVYGPRYRTFLTVDASMARYLQVYLLRRTATSLVKARQISTALSYTDAVTNAGVRFQVSRDRNDLQLSQNGVVLDRTLSANGSRRVSRRLSMDALGSANLRSNRYDTDRGDKDVVRSSASLGGGYLLARACSTTVRFSISRSHTVLLDPSASASNNVLTNYQMSATMTYLPTRSFSIRQSYLLSSEYKMFDYVENQSFLTRVRRIDTDVVDSLFSFAFLRLSHSFIYRDNGGYYRDPGVAERQYRVSLETFEQTLSATLGVRVAPGVRLIASQGLLNQRNNFVPIGVRILRNRFSLNAALEVFRTFTGGSQIIGALRHIGGYDEKRTPQALAIEEDYWIAGVTFQKEF